jgi:hypothetical protein
MGILDEAIREHLELKRQHGADDSELKQLEDEAFGNPERPGEEPGALESEAPTQFMAQPEVAPPEERPVGAPGEAAEAPPEGPSRRERAVQVADLQEPPQSPTAEPEQREEEMAEAERAEAQPGAAAAAKPVASGPSTEERRAISEQPTEMYDVEAEGGSAGAAEEQAFEEEEDEEFWSEQRLSDELDQALEAPIDLEPEPGPAPTPVPEAEPEPEAYEDEVGEQRPEDEEGEQRPEEPAASAQRDEDVLEDTPEFLEESPEDDELWFEQKPPKDFDFDD